MELFRGYVRTENKSCKQKFKDRDILNLEQAQNLDEYAGVLADDVVLIDVDDKAQSEILMKIVEDKQLDCRVYETTRGKHFLFRNPEENGIETGGNSKRLACGLVADVKVGRKNSYSILKFKGKERFIEWDIESGEYQDVPKFLHPVNSSMDFLNMPEGSGRNNSLFSYILTLQSNGYSISDCKETIHAINDYVLDESLSDDELEKILRDDAFKKDIFFIKGQFQFDTFANFLMNRYHIIKLNGRLHIYDSGVYVDRLEAIEHKMLCCIKNLKKSQRAEVLDYLRIEAPEKHVLNNVNLIAFKNGILNLETGGLEPFNPGCIMTNKIPFNYNPQADCELVNKTLDKLACGDAQIRLLLEECAGYCLYRRNELGKAFMLTGGKSNGKSTFLDMVLKLLGESNVANLDVSELGHRFSTVSLFGKLANIGDDISDEFMQGNAVSTFKKIVTGSRIKAEFKGQQVFEFRPYAKLLFSANDIPRMRDKTGAVLRRLVIIPFDATFSKDDPDFDPYIISKLTTNAAMEYLARVAVEGLKRVLNNNGFTESDKVSKQLHDYEIENNPIMLFIEDAGVDSILNESTTDVYRRYSVFCAENNFNPIANVAFTKLINKNCNTELVQRRIKGKPTRLFVSKNS